MIDVKNVSFSYKNKKSVFKSVSFYLKEGEILAVMGRNGIGKTTFIKCLAGILTWSSGCSLIMGKPLEKRTNFLGYVPQAKVPSFSYTVLDFVSFGRSSVNGYFASPSKKDYEASLAIMEELDIAFLKNRFCNEISGGELQLAYIAKALVCKPRILILDEPESNLDFYNQGRVLKTLKKLSRQNKTTIIINSHPIQNMLIIADKGLLLSEGHFLFGSIDLLITNENIKTFFNSDVFVLPVLHEGQSFKTFVVKL